MAVDGALPTYQDISGVELRAKEYELQYRRLDTPGDWSRSHIFPATGDLLEMPAEEPGDYEFRIRCIPNVGQPSEWVYGTKTIVGINQPPPAPSQIDVVPGTDHNLIKITLAAKLKADQEIETHWTDDLVGSPNPDNWVKLAEGKHTEAKDTYETGALRWYRARTIDFQGNTSTWTAVKSGRAKTSADGADVTLANIGLGENLIINGGAELGDLTGFSEWDEAFEASFAYAGSYVFRATASASTRYEGDQYIPVDPNDWYLQQVAIKYIGSVQPTWYGGVAPYDKDKVRIERAHINHVADTATTLAAEALSGATTVQLTSATNWIDDGANYVAFDVEDDYSDKPNRNVYRIESIAGTTVTLTAPLAQTYALGTKVREHRSGGSYIYAVAANLLTQGNTWDLRRAVIEGLLSPVDAVSTGSESTFNSHFWPGTAYVRPVFLLNRDTGGVAVTTDLDELKLSVIQKGDALRYSDDVFLDDRQPAELGAERTTNKGTDILVDNAGFANSADWGNPLVQSTHPTTRAGYGITDAQPLLPDASASEEVLHRDFGGDVYFARKFPVESINSGKFHPLSIQTNIPYDPSILTPLGNKAVISNPGRHVNIRIDVSMHLDGVTGTGRTVIVPYLSFDGGATEIFSAGSPSTVYPTVTEGTQVLGSTIATWSGIPTGDIHIGISGRTVDSGATIEAMSRSLVAFLIIPNSQYSEIVGDLAVDYPTSAYGSCSKDFTAGTTCNASVQLTANPIGGVPPYEFFHYRWAGTDLVTSGSMAQTCTVSGTHETADGGTDVPTQIKCDVTGADYVDDATTPDAKVTSSICAVTLEYFRTYTDVMASMQNESFVCEYDGPISDGCTASGQMSCSASGGDESYSFVCSIDGEAIITSGALTSTPTVEHYGVANFQDGYSEYVAGVTVDVDDGRGNTDTATATATFTHVWAGKPV